MHCVYFVTALFFACSFILQVARAVDAVALKARAAAVSETYATQGLRSAAILPFTSALGGLCAAASAAAVELLPFVHEKPLQALVAFVFPAAGGFFAAAASVSKSRCEVDAAAAKAASEAFAEAGLTAKDRSEKGALQPFRYVGTLIGLAVWSWNTLGAHVHEAHTRVRVPKNLMHVVGTAVSFTCFSKSHFLVETLVFLLALLFASIVSVCGMFDISSFIYCYRVPFSQFCSTLNKFTGNGKKGNYGRLATSS